MLLSFYWLTAMADIIAETWWHRRHYVLCPDAPRGEIGGERRTSRRCWSILSVWRLSMLSMDESLDADEFLKLQITITTAMKMHHDTNRTTSKHYATVCSYRLYWRNKVWDDVLDCRCRAVLVSLRNAECRRIPAIIAVALRVNATSKCRTITVRRQYASCKYFECKTYYVSVQYCM